MIGSRGLLSEYSGIEVLLSDICPRLIDLGHSVTVFGDKSHVRDFAGVALETTPALRTKHLETLSRSMIATIQASRGRFDVLHFHDVGPALFAPIGRLFGIPSVLTLHSLDWMRSKWSPLSKKIIRRIESIAVKRVGAVTVVSESLRGYLAEEYNIDSEFLPNVVESAPTVEPTQFSADLQIEPKRYLLFAARLSPEKAAHELIDAFRQLDTDLALVIAGNPGYDQGYSRMLRRSADGLNIVFTGHVGAAQLSELFSNAYAFVLPSHTEGRSMALLEAIAHGTPVLVSDIPENIEIVQSQECTFAAGEVADLTEKLNWLIAQPSKIEFLRDHVARLAEQQPSWDDVISGYEAVYYETLHRRPK
jgi:glycosyltransferase involved in cell wall biosynthesis